MPRYERCAAIAMICAIFFGLIVIGGAWRWGALMVAAAALLTVVPYLLCPSSSSPRSDNHRVFTSMSIRWSRWSLVLWLALAALASILQLVPLPAGAVAASAPTRSEVVTQAYELLGQTSPRWMALSFDPAATLVAAAKLVAYVAFAVTAVCVTRYREARLWLVSAIVIAGTATAVTGLGHHVLEAESLFGLYHPRDVKPDYLAPLLNSNHFAGYLAMCAPLALALASRSRGGVRLLWISALALVVATNLLLASRIGVLALGMGLATTLALLMWQHVRRRHRSGRGGHFGAAGADRVQWQTRIAMAVVAASAAVVLVSVSGEEVQREFVQTEWRQEMMQAESKVDIWRRTIELIGDNAWTGVGHGAFEPAFTRLHHSGIRTISHVENQYLQAFVDWGLLIGGALLAWLVYIGAGMFRRWRDDEGSSWAPTLAPERALQRTVDDVALDAGCTAAVVATAVHAGADFHLEMAPIALSAIIVTTIALTPVTPAVAERSQAASNRSRASHSLRHRWLAPAVRISAWIAALALVIYAATPAGQEAPAAEAELRALLQAETADGPRVIERGRQLIARYPGDYVLWGLVAQAHFAARDPLAVSFVNRALNLNPQHPGLHALAARILLAAGYDDQAMLEYQMALTHTYEPRALLAEILRYFPQASRAERAIPKNCARLPMMAFWLRRLQRADVAFAVAREVYRTCPKDLETLRVTALLAVKEGQFELASDVGQRAYARGRTLNDATVLARAWHSLGQWQRALAVLDDARARAGASVRHESRSAWIALYRLTAQIHRDRGDMIAARASLRTALDLSEEMPSGAERDSIRADLHRQWATEEAVPGRPHRSERERERERERAGSLTEPTSGGQASH